MMKYTIAILILFNYNLSYAGMCACNKDLCPPIETKFSVSEDVYLAEIMSVHQIEVDEKILYRPNHKIKLKIKEVFKGNPSDTEIVYTRHVPLDANYSLSTDININVGKKYIIFKRPEKEVSLSLCPTFHEHESDEMISFLRNEKIIE